MSQILDATLNKVITAWTLTTGPSKIEFELDGGDVFSVEAIIDKDDEAELLFGFPDEQPQQPEQPAASDRYAALLETVHNMYSHTVEIDTATGALVCRGCQRENIDLAKESCGE